MALRVAKRIGTSDVRRANPKFLIGQNTKRRSDELVGRQLGCAAAGMWSGLDVEPIGLPKPVHSEAETAHGVAGDIR